MNTSLNNRVTRQKTSKDTVNLNKTINTDIFILHYINIYRTLHNKSRIQIILNYGGHSSKVYSTLITKQVSKNRKDWFKPYKIQLTLHNTGVKDADTPALVSPRVTYSPAPYQALLDGQLHTHESDQLWIV